MAAEFSFAYVVLTKYQNFSEQICPEFLKDMSRL
jgi:hypothetical protein